MNIVKVSTVLAVTLLVLDYVLLSPNVYGTFFFGKITIALYWFLQMFFLAGSRVAYRYFRYTRTLQHARRGENRADLVLGPAADAEVLLRGDRERSGEENPGRSASCRRRAPTAASRSAACRCLGDFDDLERVVAGSCRTAAPSSPALVMTPTALAPEDEARSRS